MPPTTRAAAAAAATAAVPLPNQHASSSHNSFSLRQTRRNTQTVSNDEGTHVMDPWKDDRLRDFVAINVQTRIRSFHLPDGAPLADAGAHNRQRVDQLHLLPRTTSRCGGNSIDCPLRRMFCRTFGPTALHHEQHNHHHGRTLMRDATPLFQKGVPDTEGHSPSPLGESIAQPAVDGYSETAGTRRSLFHGESADGNEEDSKVELQSSAGNGSLEGNLAGAVRQPAPEAPNRAISVTTQGSATPADYRQDLDCSCCPECVESMCNHYQSLLTRGVIFDRFSQKELLFAHWVLFQNMGGAPIDSHSAQGRKEALSIQVKSGYYDLLKVPKAEDTASPLLDPKAPPPLQSPQQHGGPSMPPPVVGTVGRKRHSRDDVIFAERRKRERAEEEEGEKEDKAGLAPHLLLPPPTKESVINVTQKTHSSKRTTTASEDRAADVPPINRRNGVAAELGMRPPLPKPKGGRKQTGTGMDAPPTIKHEVGGGSSPTASSVSTPTHATSSHHQHDVQTSNEGTKGVPPWGAPPAISLGAQAGGRLSKHARVRQRELEAALVALMGVGDDVNTASAVFHQLTEEHRHPAVSTVNPLITATMLQNSSTPLQPTKSQGKNKRTTATPMPTDGPQMNDADVVAMAASRAMEKESLPTFTFEQQCLLLLAASRTMCPNVAVGPKYQLNQFQGNPSGIQRLPMVLDYWSPSVATRTLDPPVEPRGVTAFGW